MLTRPQNTNFKTTIKTILWIIKLVYSFSPLLFVTLFVFQILSTVTPFYEQRYLSYLIDSLIQSISQHSNIWIKTFLIFFIIRILKILFAILKRIFQHLLNFQVQNKLRKYYLDHTSNLDYQQFEDEKVASLMAKVNEEYDWRTREIISEIFDLIVQTLSFSTVIILLLPRYWFLSILLIIGEIPGLFVDKKWQKISWRTFNHYNELSRPGWDAAWQLVDKKYIAELKINHAINWLKLKFTSVQDEFTQTNSKNRKDRLIPDLLTSAISIFTGGVCMILIINDINSGVLSVGLFTFYFGIIRNTGDYFSGILTSFVSINEQVLYINHFREITELPKIIKTGRIKKGISSSPSIEFKNLSFKYPNTTRYIFKNLNLKIKAGEEIAIVGQNGAGKSTLVKLLCRFYDPTEGQILVNDINIKKYNTNYWYKHLSLLTQEFNVYPNLSLMENVAIGNPLSSRQKVISALKKSEAYEFVKKYKQGLNTIMSQRYGGAEPSWGQWQKIAIARIFYRNTPLMVLDEPTASIDAIAESKIFSRLYRQLTKKTLIVISHRFSTVRNAQRIIVLDKGKIIEQGSHQELIKLKGLYSKSFNLQAKGYQEA
ncbi:ABC transporter ATP-binding protein/permease [Patescibacteria group bacterium]|nr:ABC transporter ATP-binding protein/permease [Patescibacteria group bacterium]